MEKPELGDVILSDHKIYNHYGIYAGNNKVIHYQKDENNIFDGIIKETDFKTFLDGGNLYICQFNEEVIYKLNELFSINLMSNALRIAMMVPGAWPAKIAACLGGLYGENVVKGICDYFSNKSEVNRSALTIYDAEETVSRARSKIGTGDYNLFSYNCEHFAIWCKTGLHESKQVKKAIKIIVPFYN